MSKLEDRFMLSPQAFRTGIQQALGKGPDVGPPTKCTYCGEMRMRKVTLKEYEYINGFGETVGLTVAEPKKRKWKNPVIAIHQTNACGRKELFGLAGDLSLDYGLSLAKRGHRVFAIDLFLTGERRQEDPWDSGPFYAKFPTWSVCGKDMQDMQDVAHLMQQEFGETSKIHCIGHSQGGLIGFFLASLDARVSRLVSSSAYLGPDPHDPWHSQLYTSGFLNSSLKDFCLALHMDLLISLAGSNADVLMFCYADDEIMRNSVPSETAVARFNEYSQRVKLLIAPGKHSFPSIVQAKGFLFLESRLGGDIWTTRLFSTEAGWEKDCGGPCDLLRTVSSGLQPWNRPPRFRGGCSG